MNIQKKAPSIKSSKIIYHPFLISLFPILFYYNHNKQELDIDSIIKPSLLIIGIIAFSYIILMRISRKTHEFGLVLSLVIVFFSFYGHLTNILPNGSQVRIFFYSVDGVFASSIIFLIFSIFILNQKKNLSFVTAFLNITSIILVSIQVLQIGYFEINKITKQSKIKENTTETSIPQSHNLEKKRDVYYIVIERYASNDNLKKFYNFDNQDFTGFLTRLGFKVLEKGKANYLTTTFSLASSLNMKYLSYLTETLGDNYQDREPLFDLINNNILIKFFKSQDYQYIHIGPYWVITSHNPLADINYTYSSIPISDFTRGFLATTIVGPITEKLFSVYNLDKRTLHYNLSLDQIKKTAKLSHVHGPKFVFVHLYITHPPYVFDQKGNYINLYTELEQGLSTSYINTLTYANTQLKKLLEELVNSSELKPIIILQSDEGAYFERYMNDKYSFDWTTATKKELKQKTGILNAYYLPEMDKDMIDENTTPVNSFRIILNQYFNTNLDILPDKIYTHADYYHPYKFIEITDKVR